MHIPSRDSSITPYTSLPLISLGPLTLFRRCCVGSLNEWIKDCTNHNIPSALTLKSEEFEGLKPTDCLPSVWSMFLHNAHGTMISGSSFMIDDRFATYRVWCRFIHYKTDKIMEELQFRSQVCIQCGGESADAAPSKDLEGNICRLIQPLEREDYTIYHL